MKWKTVSYCNYKGEWVDALVNDSLISQFEGRTKLSHFLSDWDRVTAILRGDAEGVIGLTGETIITKILR